MMYLFFSFFCFFASLALLSALLVIISKNPIHSVLFLILCFCNVSALLFLLNLEFMPITFLIVYVGAIAVLFLFVLMMLNIKLAELKIDNVHFIPAAITVGLIFLFELLVLTRLECIPFTSLLVNSLFLSDLFNNSVSFINIHLFYVNESNMRGLGQVLFVEYWVQFVLVGFVLLFAMIGAIVLTVQKKFLSRSQNVYFQILRTFNSCVFSYS